jgi:RNA polymerase sigma-B factor
MEQRCNFSRLRPVSIHMRQVFPTPQAVRPRAELPAHPGQQLAQRYARSRADADLDRAFAAWRPLAHRLARRYFASGAPLEDLEQVACLGLVHALKRFDADRGVAFTSFAVPTILGELRRFLRDTAWAVHVPRRVQERVAEVWSAVDDHRTEVQRPATPGDIAGRMGCSVEEVSEALLASANRHAVPLDAPLTDDDHDGPLTLPDVLGHADPGFALALDLDAIRSALPTLTPPQRRAIELRFGEDLTQSAIAERLGVSQMQVSRLLRSGLDMLARIVDARSEPRRLAEAA